MQEVPVDWLPGADTTVVDAAVNCQREVTLGMDYRGTVNTTTTGVACQAWNTLTPNDHTRTPARYPMAGLGTPTDSNNYCRNPDGSPSGVWCYAGLAGNGRWLLCDVPLCDEPLPWSAAAKAAATPDTVTTAAAIEAGAGQSSDVKDAGVDVVRMPVFQVSMPVSCV